jgi:ADP-ribose pyrophosphatase YjhB (NUDIX family)
MIQKHFTATGIVFNNRDEVLLIKHKKLHVWLPPGGHIENNELPDETVIREIYEETGVRATIVSSQRNLDLLNDPNCEELATPFLVLLEDIKGDGSHMHIDLIYLCTTTDMELTPNHHEVSEIGWFSYGEVSNLATYENVYKSISNAIDRLKENAIANNPRKDTDE